MGASGPADAFCGGCQASSSLDGELRAADRSVRAVTARPMTRRILVVDDDELLREVAQAALEFVGGWQVATAQLG